VGKGIGRQASRGKGKETTHIEVRSDEDILSEKSIATEDKIWVERAMEKRRGQ
jgi:hypothetical protein